MSWLTDAAPAPASGAGPSATRETLRRAPWTFRASLFLLQRPGLDPRSVGHGLCAAASRRPASRWRAVSESPGCGSGDRLHRGVPGHAAADAALRRLFRPARCSGSSSPAWAAVGIGFTLNASAFLGEIWRGAIQAVPRGQTEAAQALGLHATTPHGDVIMPQALQASSLPATVGFLVQLIKGTSLAAIVGFIELTRCRHRSCPTRSTGPCWSSA